MIAGDLDIDAPEFKKEILGGFIGSQDVGHDLLTQHPCAVAYCSSYDLGRALCCAALASQNIHAVSDIADGIDQGPIEIEDDTIGCLRQEVAHVEAAEPLEPRR